jgi:4'-phosphopantetheinyl transferase EntD
MEPTCQWTLRHGVAAAVEVAGEGEAAGPPRLAGRAPRALAEALAGLHAEERVHAATLAPARRRDWVAGRLALRTALAGAGLACEAAVLADDRGAPALPAGLCGSISHKRGLAVALVAPGGGARIGVDLEQWAPPRLDLASRVLTDAERAALAGLDEAARGLAVVLRFALKEAVYKAIDPLVRRYVGFREVAVWPDDVGGARVEVVAGAGDLPRDVEAAWLRVDELLLCTARAIPDR